MLHKTSKEVSKANKSRTLLRYSITYHYDILSSITMQTKIIATSLIELDART